MFDSGSFSTESFSATSFDFGEIVEQESQLQRYGYEQYEQTQFRIREGILDDQDILDLIALHMLSR